MKAKLTYLALASCTLAGCLSVYLLFRWSEALIHKENPFIRRYVQGCLQLRNINLRYNSYYFAGCFNDTIFLGNTTGPLYVTAIDSALTGKNSFPMQIEASRFDYLSPALRVLPPYAYLIDGTVPVIYKGSLSSRRLDPVWQGKDRFSQPQLLDSQTLVCSAIDTKTGASELALLHFGDKPRFAIHDDLLEKQSDGVFDSDGMLHYSRISGKVVYTYYYRNQFIIAKPSLELIQRGNTIDTLSRADIEVIDVPGRNEKKLARPPLVANRLSTVDGNLLFVASGLIGQFEDRNLWKQSSIIDVYNIKTREYIASFYLYHIDGSKAKAIAAYNGRFYALIGNRMVYYRLDKLIMEHYQQN